MIRGVDYFIKRLPQMIIMLSTFILVINGIAICTFSYMWDISTTRRTNSPIHSSCNVHSKFNKDRYQEECT